MQRLKALVVDDDAMIHMVVGAQLEALGFVVTTAENGNVALKQIRIEAPDLIVTDLIMPQKEGIETIIEIKRDYPDMRIIAISGGGSCEADRLLHYAAKLGADVVLPKPLDLVKFDEAVQDLMHLQLKQQDM